MPRRGARGPRGHQRKPKRPKHSGLDQRGGARKGAGRKPDPVPWKEVQRNAEAGSTYDRIVLGLEVPPELLQDRDTQERLRAMVDKGNAKFDLQLARALKRRGIREGSVNVLLGAARNRLDWDQQLAQTGGAPDLEGVGLRLADLVEKLAKRQAVAAAAN